MATTTNIKISNHKSDYALGYTNTEHERLIRSFPHPSDVLALRSKSRNGT
jgi:hypothetical protein